METVIDATCPADRAPRTSRKPEESGKKQSVSRVDGYTVLIADKKARLDVQAERVSPVASDRCSFAA